MFTPYVDYNRNLLFAVDWSVPSVWTKPYTPAMLTNQLFRIMNKDVAVSSDVYDMILRKTKIKPDEILTCIHLRLGRTNCTTLPELIAKIGKHEIVICLLQSRLICSLPILEDIIADLKQLKIEDDTVLKIKTKCDQILIPEIFGFVGKYCWYPEIFQMSRVSRLWYKTIMNVTFLKQCVCFGCFQLLADHVYNFNQDSTQWYFEQIKVLFIHVATDLLNVYDFPKFNQNSIQYLKAAKWHLKNVPTSLTAVQVMGDDQTMHYEDAQEWPQMAPNQLKLSVGYKLKRLLRTPRLPNAKAKFYHECELTCSSLKYNIIIEEVIYIGLQQCDVLFTPDCDNVLASQKIEDYVPYVKLNIVDTGDWYTLGSTLNDQKIYDKFIEDIIVVSKYDAIDDHLEYFLHLISNVTNPNKPKKISLLFYHNSKYLPSDGYPTPETDLFEKNDKLSIRWFFKNWDNFHANANIKQFNIGILNVDPKGKKFCFCVDLMQLPDSWKVTILGHWVSVLHLQSERFKCDDNNKWEKIFQRIETEMLIE